MQDGRGVGDEVRSLMQVIAAVSLVVLIVTVASRSWLLLSVQPRLRDLQAAALQLEVLHASTVDLETGARGYLATGAAEFLEPLEAAEPRIAQTEDRVAGLLPSGRLTQEYVALEQARQRWVDVWMTRAIQPEERATLGAAGSGAADARRLAAFMSEGKVLFDRYRDAHDALESDIARKVAAAQRHERGWLLGGGLAVGGIALVSVVVSLVARRRITSRITGPVEALAAGVGRIRSGDLDTSIEVTRGPAELVSLGRDVSAMAGTLREEVSRAEHRETEARRHAHRLDVVLTAAREVAGSLSLRYVLSSVATAVLQLGHERSRIWLLDDPGRTLSLSFDTLAGPTGPATPERVEVGAGVVGRTAKYGRPVGPDPVPDGQGLTVAVPLIVGGRVVGVLEALSAAGGDAPNEQEFEILEALAGHAAGAVSAAQLHQQVVEHAVTDALTMLPNRRAFDAEFAGEVERAVRYGRPLSVISLDLDHFKQLNDRYGHAFGDLALQQVADALRREVRGTERVYRLGGEELAIVCPETSAGQAAVLAERLRAAVESSAGPDGPPVTASLGIAELPAHAADGTALLAAADAALYAAKAEGRNRVVISTIVSVPAAGAG